MTRFITEIEETKIDDRTNQSWKKIVKNHFFRFSATIIVCIAGLYMVISDFAFDKVGLNSNNHTLYFEKRPEEYIGRATALSPSIEKVMVEQGSPLLEIILVIVPIVIGGLIGFYSFKTMILKNKT